MTETIVNFTTIPPRIGRLRKVIDSLQAQTAKIDGVILWIPKSYRRVDFREFVVEQVPKGVEVRYCEKDYGPATKILPACREFSGQDVRLIYCDDDEIYAPEWAETLVKGIEEYPDCCIAICGLNIDSVKYEFKIQSKFHKVLKTVTFGAHSRYFRNRNNPVRPRIGPVDIAQGFGGVLVRPDFFGIEAYDIPDILWTVDDIWLSGHLAARGIGIRRISPTKLCKKSDIADVNSLTSLVYENHDRVQADYKCVEFYQKNFGIWL